MPVYIAPAVRPGLAGQPETIPDVEGLENVKWRWRHVRAGFFETDQPLPWLAQAPSHYPPVYAQAVREGGDVIPDATVLRVPGKKGRPPKLFPARRSGPGLAAKRLVHAKWRRCDERGPHAICLQGPVPVDAETDEPWIEGIPAINVRAALAQARMAKRGPAREVIV
jgi:hypothetical protein